MVGRAIAHGGGGDDDDVCAHAYSFSLFVLPSRGKEGACRCDKMKEREIF